MFAQRILILAFLAVPLSACEKRAEEQKQTPAAAEASAPAAPKAVPADAKTVVAFHDGQPVKGTSVKIHGIVGSNKGNSWVLVDQAGQTMPFVFCDMASPPAGVEKGAHVVASGTVEDNAMLKQCTISPL